MLTGKLPRNYPITPYDAKDASQNVMDINDINTYEFLNTVVIVDKQWKSAKRAMESNQFYSKEKWQLSAYVAVETELGRKKVYIYTTFPKEDPSTPGYADLLSSLFQLHDLDVRFSYGPYFGKNKTRIIDMPI